VDYAFAFYPLEGAAVAAVRYHYAAHHPGDRRWPFRKPLSAADRSFAIDKAVLGVLPAVAIPPINAELAFRHNELLLNERATARPPGSGVIDCRAAPLASWLPFD
jgi:hypothetical protein